MDKGKLDRRRAQSIRAIRSCFLEMLRTRPIEEITVGSLCEAADINRSTFYRNYTDIYDLLDSIVNESFEELFLQPVASSDKNGDFEVNGFEQILRLCELTEEKKGLYRQLLFGRTASKLEQKLTQALYQLYLSSHEQSSYVPSEEISLHYEFLAHGIVGIWVAWVRDDCRLPKEKVASVVQEQILSFFSKMNDLYWTPKKRAEEMK